jgi:DNA-directed RNA polymerase specialized sigma subunit
MDARDLEAVRQIKAAVEFLARSYGPGIIAQCEIYLEDSAIAQAMAEQVVEEAVRKLSGNYEGANLSDHLYKTATEMAKAKRASMVPNLLKEDQESQRQKGKTLREREDDAIIRFRKIAKLPFKQIAEIMGISEVDARVRHHRALLNRPEVKNVRRTT